MVLDKIVKFRERIETEEQLNSIVANWSTGMYLQATRLLPNQERWDYCIIEHTPRFKHRRTVQLTEEQFCIY